MQPPITVSVEMPAYLKKYILKVYGPKEPVEFKHRSFYNRFLIHKAGLWPVKITKRHILNPHKLDICLPWCMRKDPEKQNYLSEEDQALFRKEVVADFNSDFTSFVKQKMAEGFLRKDATILFMITYNISDSDITFDAFYRSFNRRLLKRRATYSESVY